MNESGAGMLLAEAYLDKVHTILEQRAGRPARVYQPELLSRHILHRQRLLGQTSPEAYLELLEHQPEEVHALASDLLIGTPVFGRDSPAKVSLAGQVQQQLLAAYGPRGMVFRENYELIHFSGVEDFLRQPASGTLSLNLLDMLPPAWAVPLSLGVSQLLQGQNSRLRLPLLTAENGRAVSFELELMTVGNERLIHAHLISGRPEEPVLDLNADGQDRLPLLEQELRRYQQHLQNTVAELGAANAELQTVFQNSRDALMLLNKDLNLQAFNSSAEEWAARQEQGPLYVGMAMADIVMPERLDIYQQMLQTVLAGQRHEYETAQTNRQGQTFWYRVSLSPVLEADGCVSGACINASDITAHKQTELALRDSGARLQEIFNTSQESLMLLDRDLKIQIFNPGFVRWTENAELKKPETGMSILDILPPEIRPSFAEQMALILSDGRTIEIERVFTNSKGEAFWYVVTRSPVHDAQGGITGICVTARDISSRKRAEAQLTEYADRLTLILESITDAFVTLDSEGRFTYANQAAVRLLNMDEDKLVGHSLWALFPASEGALFADRYRWALIYQEPVHFEVHNKQLSAWLEVSVYPSEENFSVFLRDITEIKLSRSVVDMEREILARYATGRESINDLLDAMLRQVQALLPGAGCLIQVPSADHRSLQILRAPDLPAETLALFTQLPLMADQGLQADAALRRKPVICPDLTLTDSWRDQRVQLLARGIQAAWSYPVLSAGQDLLAVFSCFFARPRRSQLPETVLAERVSQLVAVMLENQHNSEALRQLNLRYELAARATNDVIWDWNLPDHSISWNDSLRNRFGYTELVSDSDWRIARIHPQDRQRVSSGLNAHLAARLPHWQDEYRFAHSDGSYCYVLDRAYLMLDENHQPLRMIGAMQDITERKRAEERLRESELHLLASQKIARVGSWEVDLQTTENLEQAPVSWSEECFRVFGYEPGEVTPSIPLVFSRVHPDDLPGVQAAVAHTLSTGELYSIEHRIFWSDGTEHMVWQRAELAYDAVTGAPARVIGTVQDITARKQIEEALRLSHQRYEFAARAASHAIWDWSFSDHQVYWNPALESLFGYRPNQETAQLTWWKERIHLEDRERVVKSMTRHIQDQIRNWQESYRFGCADGQYRRVIDRGFLLLNDVGEPVRMIGAMQLSPLSEEASDADAR